VASFECSCGDDIVKVVRANREHHEALVQSPFCRCSPENRSHNCRERCCARRVESHRGLRRFVDSWPGIRIDPAFAAAISLQRQVCRVRCGRKSDPSRDAPRTISEKRFIFCSYWADNRCCIRNSMSSKNFCKSLSEFSSMQSPLFNCAIPRSISRRSDSNRDSRSCIKRMAAHATSLADLYLP